MRLQSLQVDPPIHSTKSDVKALAKTGSLKTQKSLLRSPRKGRTCENEIPSAVFFYPVILLPQPHSHHPAAVPAPSHLHLGSGCSSGRLFLWFCWPATRRRGPAQVARGKGRVDSRLVGLSLQLCWTTCIVNWQFRMSRLSLVPTHVRSSRHHPAHSILQCTGLNSDLLPPFFSHLSQRHSWQYLFNENTFSNFICYPKKG